MGLATYTASLSFCFGVLVTVKTAVGIGLVFYAGHIHNQELAARKQAKASSRATGRSSFERQQSMNQLTNIERYTAYKGRIVG